MNKVDAAVVGLTGAILLVGFLVVLWMLIPLGGNSPVSKIGGPHA